MTSQPGFFSFRWQPSDPAPGNEDIAVVFKVPGAVDLTVLPDLLEAVCLGPIVPSAVVMLQFGQDGLVDALQSTSVKNALTRFSGRMPLLVFTIQLAPYSLDLGMAVASSPSLSGELIARFSSPADWIRAGLATIFDPSKVIVAAPAGYAFQKPSNDRSTYFIRAELGLATSASVAFVAFAILQRLVQSYGHVPKGLRLLLVDTMNVAATAFALREFLSLAGAQFLPQVESFHSYGGLDGVANPLPDTSLCIVSASSSMNLHRKWIRDKALSIRDVVTLVTFDDAKDAQHALYGLPARTRPEETPPSSAHDIRIAGEYFFPVMEEPRKVLLTTTTHGCPEYTKDFHLLRERQLFGAFRAGANSSTRRGLFLDADALLQVEEFQHWINVKVPQFLKAGTAQIVFQDDKASKKLAQHIAHIAKLLGCSEVKVRSATKVDESNIHRTAPIVCVAAVVGRGNALLSLSRDLRNCHTGPRLYVIGMQVTESLAALKTFDRNLTHSSHKARIEVLRRNEFLSSDTVTDSFQQELSLYQGASELKARKASLLRGPDSNRLFLPSSSQLDEELILNVDFAFWNGGYKPFSYQAEVLGTIGTVLQNARTSELRSAAQQLRSPLLMHVALDPENFARFNEGIIQAALLRAALPSELDYRGDVQASAYMATLLGRVAAKFDQPQMATLEFLNALATKRMRLNAADTVAVRDQFYQAASRRRDPMSRSVRFFLDAIASMEVDRQAF
jgi:hypothetical protein